MTVRHPERTIMHSEGSWGGAVSSRQDTDGNPRLVMGFNGVFFEESDGSEGGLVGTFLGLSEAFKEAGVARPPRGRRLIARKTTVFPHFRTRHRELVTARRRGVARGSRRARPDIAAALLSHGMAPDGLSDNTALYRRCRLDHPGQAAFDVGGTDCRLRRHLSAQLPARAAARRTRPVSWMTPVPRTTRGAREGRIVSA